MQVSEKKIVMEQNDLSGLDLYGKASIQLKKNASAPSTLLEKQEGRKSSNINMDL